MYRKGVQLRLQNAKQRYAIEAKNKKRILSANPEVDEQSGIYFLTRTDENGIRHAYIGQAKHLLTRLAQHLSGYQYIDLSIKKHGLYAADNALGYAVNFLHYPQEELDEKEQYWITQYGRKGYQLKNRTGGSQGKGKEQIAEYRPAKGYRDGIRQGKINLARELSGIASKHLEIGLREDKRGNKVSERQLEKFMELINVDSYKENADE